MNYDLRDEKFSIASEIVYFLQTENKMSCKFSAFYKKTFYSDSMIVLYDPVSMRFCFCLVFSPS